MFSAAVAVKKKKKGKKVAEEEVGVSVYVCVVSVQNKVFPSTYIKFDLTGDPGERRLFHQTRVQSGESGHVTVAAAAQGEDPLPVSCLIS